jgi:hypothetical protein
MKNLQSLKEKSQKLKRDYYANVVSYMDYTFVCEDEVDNKMKICGFWMKEGYVVSKWIFMQVNRLNH